MNSMNSLNSVLPNCFRIETNFEKAEIKLLYLPLQHSLRYRLKTRKPQLSKISNFQNRRLNPSKTYTIGLGQSMNQTNQLNNHINKTESFPNFSSKLPYRLCSAIASASSSDRRPSQRGTDSASQIGEQQTGSFGAPTAILRKQI